jgi:hypothetical protein
MVKVLPVCKMIDAGKGMMSVSQEVRKTFPDEMTH